MEIIKAILTKSSCYKTGDKITPKGLMLHSVGCPQPSASVFVRNWNGNVDACVHAFIDGNNGNVYQTLPWNHRAWHCARSGNNTHISVEMCEPDCIKYTSGSSFTCSDKTKAKAVAKRTYESAVLLFAQLCAKYKLDPLKDGVIVSHKEGYKRGIASNHGDPEHLWKGLGLGYTMDGFRQDVLKAMGGKVVKTEPTKTTNAVKEWQKAAIADGYKFPKYGADGEWGSECESVAKKAIVKKRLFYTNKNLTKIVQKAIGFTGTDVDGKCGKNTDKAIRAYQQKHGLKVDGEVGLNTWKKILNVK